MPIPLWRRIVYASIPLAAFLGLLELGLSFFPSAAMWVKNDSFDPGQARVVIMGLGDSVTYGYGVSRGAAWPQQLAARVEAAGIDGVAVVGMGRPGAGIAQIVGVNLPRISTQAEGVRVIVVLLAGHNDALNWTGGGSNPFDGATAAADTVPGRQVDTRPRLLRVVDWAWRSMEAEPPRVDVNPASLQFYIENLRSLVSTVSATGGRTFVATYLLPGEPTADLSAAQAEVIETSRQAQRSENEIIRQAAAATGADLIDLEREVSVPAQWSPAWFSDHIHPTALGQGRMTDVIEEHLVIAGALPPLQN